MTEFTHVIGSTALIEEPEAAVQEGCPRILIGLVCMASDYPCVCGLVDTSKVETASREGRGAIVLTLNLRPGIGQPEAVMAAIDLTGYRADFTVSRNFVVASFNLRRPQNAELRSWA